MTMIAILFSVCLWDNPERCREEKLTVEPLYANISITPQSCMLNAVPALVEWNHFHPNWRVAKFTCKTLDKVETPL